MAWSLQKVNDMEGKKNSGGITLTGLKRYTTNYNWILVWKNIYTAKKNVF